MEIEDIRNYCLSLPGTTEGMKWGEHLTFMVGEKMYAIFGLDQMPINASIKFSDEDFERLPAERPIFKPAPYLARAKWLAINDINLLSDEEWVTFLRNAYEIIKAKRLRGFKNHCCLRDLNSDT